MRLLVPLLLVVALPAQAEYLVDRGDTLSITVAEDPKLGREAKVDAQGQIAIARLGSVDAAGSGVDAIRDRIAGELERRDIIKNPTVLVEVSHYRPFYVGGLVKMPGAIDYEPGLTVRHAILLAGGLDIRPQTAAPSGTDLLDLRARIESTSYALLQARSRVARLEAELAKAPIKDMSNDDKLVPEQDAAEIVALDKNLLSDRLETLSADETHLKDMLSLIDFELDVLGKQAGYQQGEQAMQQKEVDNAKSLYAQGLIPLPRLQELERESSRMSRDLLENEAFAARARQSEATARYDLDSAETKWRIDVRQDLAAAMLERKRLETELESLTTAALNAGIALGREGAGAQLDPTAVIYRSVSGRSETLEAGMETEVSPGDVVEVSYAAPANG